MSDIIDQSKLDADFAARTPQIAKQLFYGDNILDLESDFPKLGSVAELRSLIRILHASLVQTDTEMAEKYTNQHYAVSCR